jgi:hypothetical protein
MKKIDKYKLTARKLLKVIAPLAKDFIKAFIITVIIKFLFVFLGL